MVLYGIEHGKAIEDFSLGELRTFSEAFDSDIYDKISPMACICNKKSEGSTSPESIEKQINDIKSSQPV